MKKTANAQEHKVAINTIITNFVCMRKSRMTSSKYDVVTLMLCRMLARDITNKQNLHKTIQSKLNLTVNDYDEAAVDVKDSVAWTINRFVSPSEIRQHWTIHIQITSKSFVNQNWKHDPDIQNQLPYKMHVNVEVHECFKMFNGLFGVYSRSGLSPS